MLLNSLLADSLWTEGARDTMPKIFLWTALALVVILIGMGIFVRFKRPESLGKYIGISIALTVGFAVAVIVSMFSLEIIHMKAKNQDFKP